MIIPIRCVSCNNIIAGKYLTYLKLVEELRRKTGKTEMEYLTATTEKTAEGLALDELNLSIRVGDSVDIFRNWATNNKYKIEEFIR